MSLGDTVKLILFSIYYYILRKFRWVNHHYFSPKASWSVRGQPSVHIERMEDILSYAIDRVENNVLLEENTRFYNPYGL